MMTHLHPPTSSSVLGPCLDRTGWSRDGFFGSAGVSYVRRKRTVADSPSSARIEKDRTEMWMTVRWADDIDAGRLFATISEGVHTAYIGRRLRPEHTHTPASSRPRAHDRRTGSG
jgi:hypothetical protein